MIAQQHFSVASRMAVASFGKMLALPRCSCGGEQSTGTSLGVPGADTAPANSPSAPAAPRQQHLWGSC